MSFCEARVKRVAERTVPGEIGSTQCDPAHWAVDPTERDRATPHSPERVGAATEKAFHLRFLAQSVVPDTQMTTVGKVVHLVDVPRWIHRRRRTGPTGQIAPVVKPSVSRMSAKNTAHAPSSPSYPPGYFLHRT
ncbi:hypothetical protein GCM10022295_22650 [Streptomyces osmaniensis]|uniref:Uncharacterized protein n=1 Tax=Streptomyces osmaniensis TaxID=593134 RepID=A0ABP6VS19_9ACTN